MVILEIDIHGGFARPAEGDPVIPGHTQRPSSWFALQAVEVKAGDVQLLRLTCGLHQLQDTNALSDMIWANPAGFACEINLLKSLVPERADHSCSVDYLVYSVKRLRWGGRSLSARMRFFASHPSLEKSEGWGTRRDLGGTGTHNF